jgi:LemA protein
LITLLVVLLLALAAGLFFVGIYNSMVKKRNLVDEAWSGTDVQLKRRSDLIPNLVETVRAYASHEKEIFEHVAEARSAAMGARGVADRAKAEAGLTGALRTLFAVAENYPGLRASENFNQLQGTLEKLEDEIQMARRYYNGATRDYNTTIQVFPNNMLASPFGFTAREYYEAPEGDRELPRVNFGGRS